MSLDGFSADKDFFPDLIIRQSLSHQLQNLQLSFCQVVNSLVGRRADLERQAARDPLEIIPSRQLTIDPDRSRVHFFYRFDKSRHRNPFEDVTAGAGSRRAEKVFLFGMRGKNNHFGCRTALGNPAQ